MSFADPQSITINAVPISLPRVSVGTGVSEYASSDGTVHLRIQHFYNKGTTRRVYRLDHSKIAADPLTGVNKRVTATTYLVQVSPSDGTWTNTELGYDVAALAGELTESSGANVTKWLGGES